MPCVKHHGAQGFPVRNPAFLLRAAGSGLDMDREVQLLKVTRG